MLFVFYFYISLFLLNMIFLKEKKKGAKQAFVANSSCALRVNLQVIGCVASHLAHDRLGQSNVVGYLQPFLLQHAIQEAHWSFLACALVGNKFAYTLAAHGVDLVRARDCLELIHGCRQVVKSNLLELFWRRNCSIVSATGSRVKCSIKQSRRIEEVGHHVHLIEAVGAA